MRWIQHWMIGSDCLHPRRSLFYQLGCILPDWFFRKPIHRMTETLESFLTRAEEVRRMAPGFRRDWNIGLLAHYICDYCTAAHNEEYFLYYRHRVYEVMSQRRFWASRNDMLEMVKNGGYVSIPSALSDPETGTDEYLLTLQSFLWQQIGMLHNEIMALDVKKWYTDGRIMDLDTQYAYQLLLCLLVILGEKPKK